MQSPGRNPHVDHDSFSGAPRPSPRPRLHPALLPHPLPTRARLGAVPGQPSPLPRCRHRPGKAQPSCPLLAQEMLAEVLTWFPGRHFTLVGDGAYASKALLADLDERVTFVGRLRGDAALYDPRVPPAKKGKRGPKAKKGPKLPQPKEAAAKADRKRTSVGQWLWRPLEVFVYGESRSLAVVDYEAVWPRVLGLRPLRIGGVR